jgi:hypothetical protein
LSLFLLIHEIGFISCQDAGSLENEELITDDDIPGYQVAGLSASDKDGSAPALSCALISGAILQIGIFLVSATPEPTVRMNGFTLRSGELDVKTDKVGRCLAGYDGMALVPEKLVLELSERY